MGEAGGSAGDRVAVAEGFVAEARTSLEQLVETARRHPAAAGALASPVMRQRLAQSWIEVEILRFVGYRSLTHLLRTGQPGVESSLEKVIGSETDQRLQLTAMEILGPYGSVWAGDRAVEDGGVCREFLYSRSETIMGGTSEIQRNVIAQRILGLPR